MTKRFALLLALALAVTVLGTSACTKKKDMMMGSLERPTAGMSRAG